MKIKGGNKEQSISLGRHTRRSPKRRRLMAAGVLLVLAIAGGVVANRLVKSKGFTGLGDFISTVVSNYFNSFSAEPEKVSISIRQEDFEKLSKRREDALQRGLIINDEGSYVPAVISYKGKDIKVKLRLKGHMTDHIQGEKWSFRVNVKGKDSFMGMRLFSLQHPGTRGYAYEWIYHQLMKKEDVIALRYTFVEVELNGNDLGIYAVEENFDEELVENNQRKPGPVMRFNPDLYWVDRYNEILGAKPVSEFASFQSADLEVYRTGKVLSDSSARIGYLRALGLMEGFRRGKLRTSEVFDINRLARFHAVIDLVGGHHSLDWSDIKYYYNSVTDRLEPVAYESFTVFPSRQLSGTYRFVQMDSEKFRDDYHKALFSDEAFFRLYIKALETISAPAYLDSFFASIDPALKENLAILYKEFPYKKFDKQQYYNNQKAIRKMLDTPKGFHAYYDSSTGETIRLKLGAIESLPVEITGLSLDTQVITQKASVILHSKQRDEYVQYNDVGFKLQEGVAWSDSLLDNLYVNYTVLGASLKKQVKVFPFPYVRRDSLSDQLAHRSSDISQFSFLKVDDVAKVIHVVPGKWTLDRELIIPAGYVVKAGYPIQLDIRKGGRILSWSPFLFKGAEEQSLEITSSDMEGEGIALIGTGARSVFEYVRFSAIGNIHTEGWNMTGGLSFYESPVTISNCIFDSIDAEDAVNIMRSDFTVNGSFFTGMKDDALDTDFSNGTIARCAFEKCSENAIDISAGHVNLNDLSIVNITGKALNVKSGAMAKARNIRITRAYVGVSSEDMANVSIEQLEVSDCEFALAAFKNKSRSGPATIAVSGLKQVNVKQLYVVEKNSSITIDGNEAKNKTSGVDKLLKKENL